MSLSAKSQFQAVPAALPSLASMPRLLKIKEVAAYLAISDDLVSVYRDNGELEFINIASPGITKPAWRVTRESLAAFMQRRQVKPK